MRTITTGEAALLAGVVFQVQTRVKVANGSGTMTDLSSWVESVSIVNEVDQPVGTATISFRRDDGEELSLAPLRTDSTLNREDDETTYSPLLDAGRAITIETAVTELGTDPVSDDWKLLFKGSLDVVNFEKDPVRVTARDEGGDLVDQWIENEQTYGGETVSLEDTIQAILDDTLGPGVVTLYTPAPTSFVVKPYKQQKESLMDAIQTLAGLIGWDLRYKWDNGTESFRLTLDEPPRGKTTPDFTFGPGRYIDVTQLFVDRTNIRNAISVSYRDAGTGKRDPTPAFVADDDSIEKYGRRYMQLIEADDSSIDSWAEANDLAGAALLDLKDPVAEQAVEMHFWWPGDFGDLYRFSNNSVHYNTNQDIAVVSIRHDLARDKHRTTILVRGKPCGRYLTWLRDAQSGRNEINTTLLNFRKISETDVDETYGWDLGSTTAEVWAAYSVEPTPLSGDPMAAVRAAVAPLSPVDATTFTVPKPTDKHATLFRVEPRDDLLVIGSPIEREIYPLAEQPVVSLDDTETATTATQWVKITERGIAVSSVLFRTQVGTNPISDFGIATRVEGDSSDVKGGTLGILEFEHDVTLDATRQSYIDGKITLANGEVMTLGPWSFDRDKAPAILSVKLAGTLLDVLCDSDTRSIKISRIA